MCVKNNGVKHLDNDANIDNVKKLEAALARNLVCSIDYLAFTILDEAYNYESGINEFGFSVSEFRDCGPGRNGYQKMYKYYNGGITVYVAGRNDMGIHFEVSSKGIATFVEHFQKICMIDVSFEESALDLDKYTFNELFRCSEI